MYQLYVWSCYYACCCNYVPNNNMHVVVCMRLCGEYCLLRYVWCIIMLFALLVVVLILWLPILLLVLILVIVWVGCDVLVTFVIININCITNVLLSMLCHGIHNDINIMIIICSMISYTISTIMHINMIVDMVSVCCYCSYVMGYPL